MVMCGALAGGIPAAAQHYPERPIRVVIPQAPGATTDILGRIVLTRMSERLEKQIVVDNRPGAGGTLGMEIVARAVPDGYTLAGIAASMLTIAPHTYQKIAYDPLRDFLPVGLFVISQTAICVNAGLPAKTVREFVELAKAKPRQLNMSSAGLGSTSHLGGLMFATLAGIEPNHVPYKGGGPSILALAQGEAHWTVAPISAVMPQVRTGRIRCLATGGERRSVVTPELPTIIESGVPGFRFHGWNGVVAPRGTPRAIIVKLNRVMGEVLATAEVRKLFFETGEEPSHGSPEDFGKLIRDEYEQMGRLVKLAGVKAE